MVMKKSLAVTILTLSALLLVITPLAQVAAVPIELDHHRPGHGGGPGGDPGGDDDGEKIIVVNRENKRTWKFIVSGSGVTEFVVGPDPAPRGAGSVHFDVTEGKFGGIAGIWSFGHDKTKLADLTSLSYSTYMRLNGDTELFPLIILRIDSDGDRSLDESLFFEPVYQEDFILNEINQWRFWDALKGTWWHSSCGEFTNFGAGNAPDNCKITISDYIGEFPKAQIVNDHGHGAGILVLVGDSDSPGVKFDGNVDAFKISNITYDFEPPK